MTATTLSRMPSVVSDGGLVSAWSVGVLSVVDTDDDHLAGVFVQAVQHPVRTAAGNPDTGEFTA